MDFFKKLSDYDVFAYIPPGLFALLAFDYVSGTNLILGGDPNFAEGVLIFIGAYAIGQVLASPASLLLERLLTKKCLGHPSVTLINEKTSNRLLLFLFDDFFTPLDKAVREKAQGKLKEANADFKDGESIFWTAYPQVKNNDHVKPRLSSFINMYGFNRNLAFVVWTASITLAVKVALAWFGFLELGGQEGEYIAVGAVLGFLFYQRFLKFYRLYTVEVLVAYAS